MNTFSLFEVFLVLGIGQGLLLVIALNKVSNKNEAANPLLSAIILIASVMLTGRVLSFYLQTEWVLRLAQFVDASIFLLGPLSFLYLLRLSNPSEQVKKLSIWHFVPALAHFSFSIWTCFWSMAELGEMYISGELMYALLFVEGVAMVLFGGYWIACIILVRKWREESQPAQTAYNDDVRKFIQVFMLFTGVSSAIWIASFTGKIFDLAPLNLISYELLWAVIPLFFYALGYYALLKPSILREPHLPKNQRDRLDFSSAQLLKTKLDYLMQEEKLYREVDLTLKYLAEKLDTSANNLSWLLNKVHQRSFYDYINEIRVQAFIEKVDNGEHTLHTLLGLAMGVGFKSKSTFNKAFKASIGLTPSTYVKNYAQKEYEGTQKVD
ncbi:MAG: helix-turn-helix domain-containing protein [Bacteroidota bacterium]